MMGFMFGDGGVFLYIRILVFGCWFCLCIVQMFNKVMIIIFSVMKLVVVIVISVDIFSNCWLVCMCGFGDDFSL